MFTFYLVRHGNTEHNANGRIMGQIDTPLTKEGSKDAKLLAKKLRKIDFDGIYSSDLGRAFITAYLINQERDPKLSITPVADLRETNYGIYQNELKVVASKKCPYFKRDAKYVYPGGESAAQSQARAVNYLKKLERRHKDEQVLIVSHSGLIRTIIAGFNNLSLTSNLNLKISHQYIGKFEIEKGKLLSYSLISK